MQRCVRWSFLLVLLTISFALVLTLTVQAQDDTNAPLAPNPIKQWLKVIAGGCVIWLACYKGLYPLLLRYYSDRSSKAIFWPMLFLWLITWLHVSFYIFFAYGFEYFWTGLACIVLVIVCALWFLFAFLRRE